MAHRITALVVQERKKDRVNVYLDGEFAFGLTMLEALKLKKGQVISDEDITRLKARDEVETAHESALKFLAYRPRSVAEVRRKLAEKRFAPVVIDEVVVRLEQTQLLNDMAFAAYWLDNRSRFDPRSARAVRSELRKKGVADSDITVVLGDFDDFEAAYAAARQQSGRYIKLDAKLFQKKLGDFLLRRGFSYSTARDVIKRLWVERDRDPNEALNADGEKE